MKRQTLIQVISAPVAIPANSRSSLALLSMAIPLSAHRKIRFYNLSLNIFANAAADTLKVACDSATLFLVLQDLNGVNLGVSIGLLANPWQQGALIPFSTDTIGLVTATLGNPLVEVEGNLELAAVTTAGAAVTAVAAQATLISDFEVHNTDGAAAHSVVHSFQALVALE